MSCSYTSQAARIDVHPCMLWDIDLGMLSSLAALWVPPQLNYLPGSKPRPRYKATLVQRGELTTPAGKQRKTHPTEPTRSLEHVAERVEAETSSRDLQR